MVRYRKYSASAGEVSAHPLARVAGSTAILGAMLSEWITGSKGLGKLILDAGEMRETELLWAAVITSVVVALCVFWTTSAAEQRLLRWKH